MTIDDTLAPAGGEGAGASWSAATLPWRLAETAAAGALGGVLMILTWLNLRPDLPTAAVHAFFWIKAAYPAAIAACALVAATRLARGRPGGFWGLALAAAIASAMLVAAGVQAANARSAALAALSWPKAAACLGNILVIAAPMLVLTAAGLRDLDLPRPTVTGFACGLFCGSVAAAVDGLHCGQTTYAFVGLWFTLAMLVAGGVGAGAVRLFARRRLHPAE